MNEFNETTVINKNTNKNGLIKKLLMSLLAVILFLLLLTWFFPTKNSISPLMQDVFRNNMTAMQDSAKSYFTNERLPQKEGESVKLTLKEMLDKKLLLPFVDKNGKQCDMTDSYVSITREKTEYVLKVNLSCSDQKAYILEHVGCHDVCALLGNCKTCTGADCDAPIIQYEFKRDTSSKAITGYKCPDGYVLNNDTKKCTKTNTRTLTEEAKANYKDEVKITNRPYEDKEAKKYLYKYMKEITTTTYIPDTNQPIRHYTYDNIIGYYTKKVCTGYNYFIDQTTGNLYQGGEVISSYVTTMTTIPQDTATTRYVVLGMDYDSCMNTCTLTPYYKVRVETIAANSVSEESLVVECTVSETQVPIYGLKITFSGFVTDRIVTKETKTEWSESKTDATLIADNYGYVGIRKENGTETVRTYGNCPNGSTVMPTDESKCTKTEQVLTGYSCPTAGYNYNGSSKKCEKVEVIGTDTKDSTPIYGTIGGIEYKWSKCKTLEGWKATGRTREV